ncbi:MAG: adenylate kinase family protein [Candidatus Bathyarchaeota archaeon]|nr:MAG: adenylate kinase family protein [Candidatus Bathyarchaeota archaeon]
MGRVIVITGTPGVGKTVVSKALAKKLGALYVSLTDVVKKENLVLRVDEKRNTLIVDMRQLSKKVCEIIGNSTAETVVEGHYATDVVPSSLVSYVFVLRRDLDDLKTTLKDRGYEEKKVLENLAAEALDVCLFSAVQRYGDLKVDEIDVTHLDVVEVVEEIYQVLTGQKTVKVGKIDWLGKLEREGRLEEFLQQFTFL